MAFDQAPPLDLGCSVMGAAMFHKKNPATCYRGRDLIINAVDAAIDGQDPTDLCPGLQSQSFAVSVLQRRFRLSYWHARVVSQLSGLGGAE